MIIRYIRNVIIAISLCLLCFISLFYFPPVQHYLKNKVVDYLAEKQQMILKVGDFHLKFPFLLSLEEVYCGSSSTDTLFALNAMRIKVNLGQIFRQQLTVEEFFLRGVTLKWEDQNSGILLDAKVGTVELST